MNGFLMTFYGKVNPRRNCMLDFGGHPEFFLRILDWKSVIL